MVLIETQQRQQIKKYCIVVVTYLIELFKICKNTFCIYRFFKLILVFIRPVLTVESTDKIELGGSEFD